MTVIDVSPVYLSGDIYVGAYNKTIKEEDFKKIIYFLEKSLTPTIKVIELRDEIMEYFKLKEYESVNEEKNIFFSCHWTKCKECFSFISCKNYNVKREKLNNFFCIKKGKTNSKNKGKKYELNKYFLIYYLNYEEESKKIYRTKDFRKLDMTWNYINYWLKFKS